MSADPRLDLARVLPLLDTFGGCPVVAEPAPHDWTVTTDIYDDLWVEAAVADLAGVAAPWMDAA